MKNIVLILNAFVLIMTLSVVVLQTSIIGGADGPTGMVIPIIIWIVYVGLVFLSSAVTFFWLVKK